VLKRISWVTTVLLLGGMAGSMVAAALGGPAMAQVHAVHAPLLDGKQLDQEGAILLQEALQLAQIQQTGLAVSRAKLATQLIPQNSAAWSILGGLYLSDNQPDQSITALGRAQVLTPKEPAIWFRLGTAYFQKKDYPKSVEALLQGLTLKPNEPGALFDLGNAYLMQRRLPEAIRTYEQAAAQDKQFWYPVNNIALIKYEAGDVREAIRLWRNTLAVDGKAAEPMLALAAAVYKQGDRAEGLKLALAAVKIDARYAETKFLKDNLWGDKLISDTQVVLSLPSVQAAVARAAESRAPE
jgi:tetratricopeptide (TPR) repeat protein